MRRCIERQIYKSIRERKQKQQRNCENIKDTYKIFKQNN